MWLQLEDDNMVNLDQIVWIVLSQGEKKFTVNAYFNPESPDGCTCLGGFDTLEEAEDLYDKLVVLLNAKDIREL